MDKTKDFQKRMVKVFVTIVVFIVLCLFVVPIAGIFILISGHVHYNTDSNHPLQKVYTGSDFGLSSEEMYLTTEDDYNIWVSEVFVENPKAVIIYLSGIHQPSVTYFYGHSAWIYENGYASILLEVRGHGNSGGNRIGLGYEEVNDVNAVVEYIMQQEKYADTPIVIHGVSMGGAVAVNAFGQNQNIDGLIAMSAYSSFEDVFTETMRQYYIPEFLCHIEKPFVRLALMMAFGAKANDNVPIKQAANIGNRPALFIASSNDTEVLPVNIDRLLSAAPKHCESWLRDAENTGHFIIADHDIENVHLDSEYCDKILQFLEKSLLDK